MSKDAFMKLVVDNTKERCPSCKQHACTCECSFCGTAKADAAGHRLIDNGLDDDARRLICPACVGLAKGMVE